ncbi:imidazolonepropionase [Pectinatus haikarae]|uniref:Imidazolonepropionase n=1 Tax=Pectinatus haikarae TaxID=349096 RepID=A0ABT9Y3F8_9FIRM|nr:imidazolonepropionase [Pectinatus haikarae]MDQ0202357.1 imidazolonepropionase [Pectinatus haikarae]
MNRLLIKNLAEIATPLGKTALRGKAMNDIKIYKNGAIYCEDGIIKLAGTAEEVLPQLSSGTAVKEIDAHGKCAVPGFVDPHTHFLFGGTRADEFIARLEGVPYMDLLKRGGGIVSTMRQTRVMSEENMYSAGKKILENMLKQGFTTIEGKSGYGLDKNTELKMLRTMKRLQKDLPITLKTTFLGAHAVPPEFAGRSNEFIDFTIEQVFPEIQKEKLAEFCDVFCEKGVFSIAESQKLLLAAKETGMKAKIHADEIVSTGGGGLAADIGAVSADHLLAVTDEDIKKLAGSNTAAVLLPMTAFCMRKQFAPARQMIDTGCIVALASDFNPGSCYSYAAPLILALAVINMHLTINEALTAITLNAAAAVDEADTSGSIEPGKKADILLLSKSDYRFLVYLTGINIVEHVIKNGEIIF